MGSKQAKTTKPVESNLPAVVKRIHDKCPEVSAAILSLLHLGRRPIARVADGLMFAAGTAAQHLVRMDGKSAEWIMKELVEKFHVGDSAAVQAFLRHRWSSFKPRADRQALGQYFTPHHVVAAIAPVVQQLVATHPDAVILDPAAGGGALVSHIQTHRTIVADRDPNAAALLRELGYAEVLHTNSLMDASRAKFGVAEGESLIVLMNPPFKGDNRSQHECDKGFAATDQCVSFLRLAASLKPEAIVCIQPLTTLIKERNFKQLGSFASAYTLESAHLVSSAEFGLGGEEFPLVIACYAPGQMTFAHIEQFSFPVLRNVAGQLVDGGERLQLSKVQTTKGLIRNTPPNKGASTTSPIGLYQFNFRHINFVIGKGNLSETPSDSMIPVDRCNLGHYAYINCFKRYFKTDFVVGNLDPLCRPSDLADSEFEDACVYDTVMANSHRISGFARGNSKSALITASFLAAVGIKAKAYQGAHPNPHQAFLDWWSTGKGADALKPFFVGYFAALKAASLVHAPLVAATTPDAEINA